MNLLKHHSSAQQASYFIVSAFLKPHVHILHQRLLFQRNYWRLNPRYPSKLQGDAQPAFFKRYLIWQKDNTHHNQETFCLIPPAPPCQALSHTNMHAHTRTLAISLSYRHTCALSLTHTLAVSHRHSLSLSLAVSAIILRSLVLLSTRHILIYPKSINFIKSTHTGKLLGQACSHLYNRKQAHKLLPFWPAIFNIKGHILVPVVLHTHLYLIIWITDPTLTPRAATKADNVVFQWLLYVQESQTRAPQQLHHSWLPEVTQGYRIGDNMVSFKSFDDAL